MPQEIDFKLKSNVMRKILLTMLFIKLALFAFAQQPNKGDLQMGIQGGISMPVGAYKTMPSSKWGYYSGFFVDKYLRGNRFGIGVDARYIYNSISKQDSFHFENGFIETSYTGKTRFQDYLFTLGPSYRYTRSRFQLEAYLRGGIMVQYFPAYVQTIHFENRGPMGGIVALSTPKSYTNNGATNRANSWAGLGGIRFNYTISKNLAVFAHVDFVQGFAKTFGGKSSLFSTASLVPDDTNPITETTTIKDIYDHFLTDTLRRQGIHMQTINAGIGVKYIFGKKKDLERPRTDQALIYDDIPKSIIKVKDVQIVVKDKQTNLALSGVTVTIEGGDWVEKSITDAQGKATKVLAVAPGDYIVYGDKNGIRTALLSLTALDFKTNSTVIFKELYHDDPRFTLLGETFDCAVAHNLANINTVLTNAHTKVGASQISDAEGKFIYQLDPHNDYTVMANQAGRYSQTALVTTTGLDRSQTIYVTLKLGVCDLVKDDIWVLKNILYDFDRSNIRTDAALILDNVVAVMHANPSLRIELSSHTDSRGNDSYNMKLSQRRADSAVDYLVSKGIAKSRLISQGYGGSRLINHCAPGIPCTEEQHQENRRTEIRILAYSK